MNAQRQASLAVKNDEIKNEIESEKKGLMAEQATDAEIQAVKKLRSYQNADSSIQDTSIAPETDTMKQFFKKSNIYKKYEGEREQENLEDKLNDESEESV